MMGDVVAKKWESGERAAFPLDSPCWGRAEMKNNRHHDKQAKL